MAQGLLVCEHDITLFFYITFIILNTHSLRFKLFVVVSQKTFFLTAGGQSRETSPLIKNTIFGNELR